MIAEIIGDQVVMFIADTLDRLVFACCQITIKNAALQKISCAAVLVP